jgi:hypothetical protein
LIATAEAGSKIADSQLPLPVNSDNMTGCPAEPGCCTGDTSLLLPKIHLLVSFSAADLLIALANRRKQPKQVRVNLADVETGDLTSGVLALQVGGDDVVAVRSKHLGPAQQASCVRLGTDKARTMD